MNDLELLKPALNNLGIIDDNIIFLSEENASKTNILKAFHKIIDQKLKKGDLFYFHFSGHGQQVEDYDGDEIDKLDEALVPFDANSEFKENGYHGENHITDDEMNQLLNLVRSKLGPEGHVLITIDACHSGTSTRNIGSSRGVETPLTTSNFYKKSFAKNQEFNKENRNIDETKLASMVGFFASMPNQLNYEIIAENGKAYGALSYAFSKALQSLSGEASYQQLFDKIRLNIQEHNNSQIPEAEGSLNQGILGGELLESVNYYTVKEIIDSNRARIEGGFLQGLREKCKVGFYKPESRNLRTDVLLVNGEIQSCQANSSIVIFEKIQDSLELINAWVKVKEESFGDLVIHIKNQVPPSSASYSITDSIFKIPFIIKANDNPDLILVEDANSIHIYNHIDYNIGSISKNRSLKDQYLFIKKTIQNFGQTQFIRKLNQENKDIQIGFEIILANKSIRHNRKTANEIITTSDGRIIFKANDTIKIKVTNHGSKAAYYSILDIQPDYILNVLIPSKLKSPSDYYLKPGESIELSEEFSLTPPLGQENFRLVASNNPINLRPLGRTRGQSISNDPFESIISLSYYDQDESLYTRGNLTSVPAGQVNIFSIPFNIEE